MRTVSFCGYEWECKDSANRLVGPGPNLFSAQLITVDEDGLHLSLKQEDEIWKCSEVVLNEALGWGTYTFTVTTPLSPFEKRAVFGAFLYENDTQEIDIEVSPSMVGKGMGQFVVQPGSRRENLAKFYLPSTYPVTCHISWLPERVHFSVETPDTIPFVAWDYARPGISNPSLARFIFNLWLYRRMKARIPEHVTIRDFSFTPHPHDV